MSRIGKDKQKIERPKNLFKTIKRIFGYMSDFKIQLFIIFILIVLTLLARIIGTAYSKIAIDKYIEPLAKNYNIELFNSFVKSIFVMSFIYLIGVVANYIYNRIMVSVAAKTLYKIRIDLFKKMEKLPIKFFDTHSHGDIMSLYTNDIDAIRQILSNGMAEFLLSIITIIGIFIMMVYYSWELTILVVVMLFVMLNRIKHIGTKSGKYFVKQQKELGKLNGYIEEMIEGQKVVKVFCHENLSKLDFSKINEKLCKVSTTANSYANILIPLTMNLANINCAFISIIGAILVLKSLLSLGTLIAFLQYTRAFVRPIAGISQQFNGLLTALAGAERIFNLIDEKEEIDDGDIILVNAKKIDIDGKIIETNERTNTWAWKEIEKDGKIKYHKLKGEIEFKDVIFKYGGEKIVLDTINLKANMGEKIALVGSTGAGKTTITNLINRFYDIQSGEITIDGINIKNIKKNDLRKTISIVLQDTHLFTESILDNVRYGNLKATDEEVIEACKIANADDFIKHLPQGYKTILTTDGKNLSQGEKQLLAIARAIVAKSQILILDEATSSIDTRTEKLIENAMQKLMIGKTVFIIAHRLSTIRNANHIIVIENGKILESGNHNELLEIKGRYYKLHNGISELN